MEIKEPHILTTRVPFIQTRKAGCASYSLANLFNDRRFLEGTEDLERGEWVRDLALKMMKFKPELMIDTIFCTSSHFTKQANRLIDPLLFDILWDTVDEVAKEEQARPLLVTFMRPSGICHCILVVHNLKDNLLYVFDSRIDHAHRFEIGEFISLYHILQIEHFVLTEGKDEHGIFLHKSYFRHLFQLGE
jgi:hypothetical protein